MHEYILILDFGSQFTQLIARRTRENNVFSEIRSYNLSPDQLSGGMPKGLILSGGPSSVSDDGAPALDPAWYDAGIPILGLCYGMQIIGRDFQGAVGGGKRREYGPAKVEVLQSSPLFKGFDVGEKTSVWMSHGDHIEQAPHGFDVIASTDFCPIAAVENKEKAIWGLQFHPEVAHTERGSDIIRNFLFEICGCRGDWTTAGFVDESIEKIRAEAEDGNVICGLSGGVDSSVAAVLVSKALGDRLHCILVDTGLLREKEADDVVASLGEKGIGLDIKVVDAGKEFLDNLKGVTDPEEKRKIIGKTFIDVFEREARKIKNVTHLVQGTLYPDVIESQSVKGPSATIKTHHNVGGLPESMNLRLIEPFRFLFKDEVREIGRELGLPPSVIRRHPFPGPGLAVRIIGEVTEERLAMLRHADSIFISELKAAGVYDDVWQAFVVLLPVKSVGVMGDARSYELVAAIRAVTSVDGMTADWAYLPEELLRKVSARIINEVKGINRVVMDISSKPPATIEWE